MSESCEQRIERLKREHTDKLAKLKAEGQARVREVYERHDNSCGAWDLQQQFRREEDRVRRQNEDALTLARRRTARAHRKHLGLPMTVADGQEALADMIESHKMFADDPQVIILREWIKKTCAAHGIEVREDAAPQLCNGSAVRCGATRSRSVRGR